MCFGPEQKDNQLTTIQKDIMQTIAACAANYDPTIIATWSTQIWDALKYEVLNAQDDDLAKEALGALKAVAARLSFGLTPDTCENTALQRFCLLVAKECNGHIQEPQHRFAKQSGQILEAIASASLCAFRVITTSIVPPTLTVFQDFNGIGQKKALLEIFGRIFEAAQSLYPDTTTSGNVSVARSAYQNAVCGITNGNFGQFSDSLFEVFSIALTSTTHQEASYRIVALKGLLQLVKIPAYLNAAEISMIVQYLNQIVLTEERTNGQIQDEALSALQQISELHYQLIVDITFPAFMAKLPDTITSDADVSNYSSTLEGLAKISTSPKVFDLFLRRMLGKFDTVLNSEVTQEYAYAILATLYYGLLCREKQRADQKVQSDDSELKYLVGEVYQRVVEKKTYGNDVPLAGRIYIGIREVRSGSSVNHISDKLVDLVGRIGTLITRSNGSDNQMWAATELYTLFSCHTNTGEDSNDEKDVCNFQFEFDKATADHKSTAILTMHLLAGLRADLKLMSSYDVQRIIKPLIYAAVHSHADSEYVRAALCESIGLLVNKFDATKRHDNDSTIQMPQDIIRELLQGLYASSTSQGSDDYEVRGVLRVAVAFTKGAILKNDRCTGEFLNLLIDGLAVPALSQLVAMSIAHLLEPSEILCKENFANIRLLHKQRVFDTCVPTIIEKFRSCTDSSCKPSYLIALAGILKYTPSTIVMPEIETLLPLLLQSIDVPGAAVKAASLDTLGITIAENPEAVKSHIKSVITRLQAQIINTAQSPSPNPPSVRIKALKCLGDVAKHLANSITLPFKLDVVRDLENALGDPKRAVRAEAVDCRNTWLILAEPVEADDY
jgi:DNA repair/transcription protein MET18/MMS19